MVVKKLRSIDQCPRQILSRSNTLGLSLSLANGKLLLQLRQFRINGGRSTKLLDAALVICQLRIFRQRLFCFRYGLLQLFQFFVMLFVVFGQFVLLIWTASLGGYRQQLGDPRRDSASQRLW